MLGAHSAPVKAAMRSAVRLLSQLKLQRRKSQLRFAFSQRIATA
jgi:hypothetical protein